MGKKRFFLKIRSSIASKIYIVILLPLLISIVGTSLFHYFYARNAAASREIQSFKFFATEISSQIDEYIISYKNVAHHLSVMPKIKSLLLNYRQVPDAVKELNTILDTNASLSPDYYALNLLNREGLCIASSHRPFIGYNYSMRDYFKKAVAGNHYSSDWLIGIISKDPGIFFSSPVYYGKELAGILVLRIRTDKIVQLIDSKKELHLNLYLMNDMGVILHHTNSDLEYHSLVSLTSPQIAKIREEKQFGDKEINSLGLRELNKAHQEVLIKKQPVICKYQLNGEKKIAALAGMISQNWVVGVSKNYADIYAGSDIILIITFIVAVLFLLLAALVGFYLSHHIIEPISILTSSVNAFANGNIKERANIRKHDEIGFLALTFNAMADSILEYTGSLEKKIAERTQELENSNNAKDKMFSIVGHDLIGPMGTYVALLKMITENYQEFDREKIFEQLTLLLKSSENTFSLMENILSWARAQRDQIVFSPERLILNKIVLEVVNALSPVAAQKEILLKYEEFPSEINVLADKNMVHVILRNLISNAIKFTPRKGQILVSFTVNKNMASISVVDNGVGMESDKIQNIFKIGVKQNKPGTEGEKGTGLGLILCKEFVEKNNGEIQVSSDLGKGSSFVFTLPLFKSAT